MRNLPRVPNYVSGPVREYLSDLVRRLDDELQRRPERREGDLYSTDEDRLVVVDGSGDRYVLGVDAIPPSLSQVDRVSEGGNLAEVDTINDFIDGQKQDGEVLLDEGDLARNGGAIPETDRVNNFVEGQTQDGRVILDRGDYARNAGTIPEVNRRNNFTERQTQNDAEVLDQSDLTSNNGYIAQVNFINNFIAGQTVGGKEILTEGDLRYRTVFRDSYDDMLSMDTSELPLNQIVNAGGTLFRWDGFEFVLEGPLNVTSFGAVGRGPGFNDSAAVNAAIAVARPGDTIIFPAPVASYHLNGKINVDKRVTIVGDQIKVTCTNPVNGIFDITAINASVSGFVMEGNRTPGQKAFRVGNNWVKVRDCTITLMDAGFEVWGGVWHRIEHIRMRNIATSVIEIGNVVGTVVEDMRYDTDVADYDEPTVGINLYGEGCNFSDLDFIHAGTACYISTNGSRNSTWNFFNSCSFDTSKYGLRVSNIDSDFSVRGAMFDHCWFASHRENGVFVEGQYNTNGVSFKGCFIVNNAKGGMVVGEASNNVEVMGCTFAGNSQASAGTHPHIKHSTVGTVSVMDCHFTDWGGLTNGSSAAVERTSAGTGYLIIDGSYAASDVNTEGLVDNSTGTLSLGRNYGLFPVSDNYIPNDTSESSGNINITSDSPDFNTIRAVSDATSAVQGIANAAAGFGGVFANTAGGAGLRVDQGDAQFAGNVSVDQNLSVEGNLDLEGALEVDSDDATRNAILGSSSTNSGVQGITSEATAFGGVFSNTASGTGLRVDQGRAEFAGDVTLDQNLAVNGNTDLDGFLDVDSDHPSNNAISGRSTTNSGVEGISDNTSGFGGVFTNTAGGAGLRVNQGAAEFAGNVSVDQNLSVGGNMDLDGFLDVDSSNTSNNAISGRSTANSGVQGITDEATAFGGVFENTAGGAGLRVNQGSAEFAGNVSVDQNLSVGGTLTLQQGIDFDGDIDTTGFIRAVSDDGARNAVEGDSSTNSGVKGVTSNSSSYGGVFENTAGGAGLRVAQGTAEFAGNVSVDQNLSVGGNMDLDGFLDVDSSHSTQNAVSGRSTTNSGVEGITTNSSSFGGVFSNTAGGAGLRVNQGSAEFAGNVTVDQDLNVGGTLTVDQGVDFSGNIITDGYISANTSNASNNAVRGRSTTNSGVQGITTNSSSFGGVFSNTAGGAGLRVAQGSAEFAGNVTVDDNLTVDGTSTLKGNVGLDGSLTVDGGSTLKGNVTLNNNLTVGGRIDLNNYLDVDSSHSTQNAVSGRSTTNSGVQGVTTNSSSFGGVFSNTAGGAGLRVDQGSAEFAGNVTVDDNLTVDGTSTLKGNVTLNNNLTIGGRIDLNNYLDVDSSHSTQNAISGRSTTNSGVQGITTNSSSFGGVFSNTAGGAGLRVNQGSAEFAGNVTVDDNLTVDGTSTLKGNVSLQGSVTGSGVGTGSNQVARGNHTHNFNTLSIQKYRMFGVSATTNSSGRASFNHGFGAEPAVIITNTFGGAANQVSPVNVNSTGMTVEVRDLTNGGALKTNASITFMVMVAEAP